MKLVTGDKLPLALRAEVLNAWGYRWTVENLARARAWYRGMGAPTMEPTTDAQWLADHAFYVTRAGKLARRRHAMPAYLALARDYAEIALSAGEPRA